jgi:hypothetical protein
MGPIYIRLSPFFMLFVFVFSLGCVYLHSHLPCTFGWVLFLIFIYMFQGFSSHQWLPHMIPFDKIKFCDLIIYVHLLTIAWVGLDVCTNVIHYHILFQLGPYPLHKIQMERNQWEIDPRWSLKPMVVQGSFMCLVAMGHVTIMIEDGNETLKMGMVVGTRTNTKYSILSFKYATWTSEFCAYFIGRCVL